MLIVEDGSLVADADSYISLADARAFALTRGITLAVDDTAAEIQLRKGFDYIESLRSQYLGRKSDNTQLTEWPRKCVYVDCVEISSATVPTAVQRAQVQLAASIQAGIDITPTTSGFGIKREKVGPIDTEFDLSVGGDVPTLRVVDALLSPYMKQGSVITTARA